MRISDFASAKAALTVAHDLDGRLREAEPPSASSSPSRAPAAKDLVSRLGVELDKLRATLGSRAVERLIAELPGAAVDALKAAKPDMPVEPGRSPLAAYREGHRKLVALEVEVVRRLDAVVPNHIFHGGGVARDPRKLHRPGIALSQLQTMSSADELLESPFKLSGAKAEMRESLARKTLEVVNQQLRGLRPDIPDTELCAGPYGEGPGTRTLSDCLEFLWNHRDREMIRTLVPGYGEAQRALIGLQDYLRREGVSGIDDVIRLKDELSSDKATMYDLYHEALGLVRQTLGMGGGAGMIDSSHPQPGAEATDDRVHEDVYRPPATTYRAVVSPDPEEVTKQYLLHYGEQLESKNTISRAEVPILADRLLTIRRIYEAMATREPSSSYTKALESWAVESTVIFGEHPNAPTVSMGNLRQDLVNNQAAFDLPNAMIDILRDELALGLPNPKTHLSALNRTRAL